MDPVAAVGIVVGLVGPLHTTLRALNDFASKGAFRRLAGSYAHLEESSRSCYQDLAQFQSSLRANWIHSQFDELLDLLQNIEQHLDEFKATIQEVDHYSRIRSLRLIHRRRDTEAAVTSVLLAKNMLIMIRAVIGRGHDKNLLLESVRSHNQDLNEDLITAWQPDHRLPLLKAPNTKAQETFAWVAGPEGQEQFHEQCRAERIAGTCEWFLTGKEFQSWIKRRSSAGEMAIFWCRGKAGIGKTMLASKIIDRLKPRHVVAYFYMSSGKVHSMSDVMTSLLRQLCLPFHIVPKRLQQIFGQTNGKPGYRLKLKDLLEALREASRSILQPVTIIMDGLDDINIRQQSDFVQVFDSLKDTSWKCLVTSRGTEDILSKGYNHFSEFEIKDNANEKDIYNFVESVLRENEPTDRMLNSDPKLRSELIETLTLRAHGMFYWVTLQIRLVLDQTHLSGIRSALDSIPSDIHEIVNSALKMVRLQDSNRAELANRALALLTAAQAPLTADAMCHALGLGNVLERKPSNLIIEEIPNPESIIECCMGLIKMEPTTKVVTLAHYDILQEMREQWFQLFGREQTARLARTCIAYLSLSEFSKGPCHEVVTFRRRLEEHPFLDYASRYWGYHARAAFSLETCEADVSNDILLFLEQPMNLGFSHQVCKYDPEGEQKLSANAEECLGVSKLQFATRHGLTRIVRTLLKTSPDMILEQDSYGRTALHEAAQAGWEDLVRILLKAGADPCGEDDEGKTPFIYAAERGHSRVISTLKDQHTPRSDHEQKTLEEALCDAAEAGEAGVVEQLLQLGVVADAEKNDISAMTIASCKGHERIVRLLLDTGASPACLDNLPSGSIPLHQAIRNCHVNIAALLLDRGANIQTRDKFGRTALFETLNTPDVRGAALLLTNGVDISCQDFQGGNVLHEAARRGAIEHVSLFVDQGIEMAIRNKEGLTPLHLAARYGHYRVASLLVRKGAAVDQRDVLGQTPLIYAASAGNTSLCEMLLRLGASINAVGVGQETLLMSIEEIGQDPGFDFMTPLIAAVSSGYDQTARMLLENGAQINESSSSSKTPLMHAASAGHTSVVRLLLERGADTKAFENDLKSAFVLAAEAGHTEILKLLIDHEETLDATGDDLKTAVAFAEEAGHQAAAEMLRARVAKDKATDKAFEADSHTS